MTKPKAARIGKIQRQVLENIRAWGQCPIDLTHLSPSGKLVGVPTRSPKSADSNPYHDFSYHRRAVQSLLDNDLIEAKGSFYVLTDCATFNRYRVYLCTFEASSFDQQMPQVEYWAVTANSRPRAYRRAHAYAKGQGWTLTQLELVTAKTMQRIGRGVRARSPVAQKALVALNRTMTPVEHTVYGLRFIRGEDTRHIYWEASFDGETYTVLQPKGAPTAYWVVLQGREEALNTATWSDGEIDHAGPLYVHRQPAHLGGSILPEPDHLFWMTYLAEWLLVPSLYQRRKALVDRANAGEQIAPETLLSLNPDPVLTEFDQSA